MDLSPTLIWLVIGIGLLIAELVTGTFVILFFAIAAMLVSAFKGIGLHNLQIEIILFAVLSLLGIAAFRKKVLQARQLNSTRAIDGIQNATIRLETDIAPHERASIMHQGVPWTAVNGTPEAMRAGETVMIDHVEGIQLILKKNNPAG